MLGQALLVASRRPGLRKVVVGTPVTRRVVDRFVAGRRCPTRWPRWTRCAATASP
ncbi:hypothetical protein ACFQX8_01315 [Klenkia terrae]|uniref:hypothetical protein n=1 Tax=Klenkia terrae TaxID=1052259 RepID=UPI003613419F